MNIYSFVFSLFIAATITLSLAIRSWQRGASRALYFSLLLGSLSVGTFSYALELWGMQVEAKFVWLVIRYIGIVSAPVFWLIFALQYTEKRQWLQPRYFLALSFIPALTLVMLVTTYRHELMFWGIHVIDEVFLDFEYGPYFWVHALYTYFLFGLGWALILRWLRKKHILRFPQFVGLIIGALIPLASNLVTILHFPIETPFDFTVMGLTAGVLIIGWALFGLNFSGVNPIARESLIESLKDGVIVVDTQRVITDINPAALHLVSISRPPLGQPLESIISESVFLPTLDMTDTYPHQEITLPGTSNLPRILDLRTSPLIDSTRILRGWLLLLRDITEQKRLQNELKKQSLRNAALAEIELAINQPHELAGVLKKIIDTLIELLPAPGGATIMMWDEETRTFEYAESNLPAEELSKLLRRAKQGRGSAPWIVNNQQPKIVPDTREEPFGEQEVLSGGGIKAYAGLPLIANNKVVGVLYANDNQPRAYAEDDLQFLKTLANRASNAIYRVQQFSQIQEQAITDHVTGIHNRRQLFNLGELEFKRARRFNRPLSAIMLDIDHFKDVNDTYGHAKGDQVLKSLAQFLKIHLRDFDILGRYGGEEFVIVLPGADLPNACNVAYRLRKGVQERPMINGSVSITISLGVAQLSNEIPDFQSLMNKADMAMYDAKRAGRNRVAWNE
jgi:diguanylate cyclase (GGDEF)-like protein